MTEAFMDAYWNTQMAYPLQSRRTSNEDPMKPVMHLVLAVAALALPALASADNIDRDKRLVAHDKAATHNDRAALAADREANHTKRDIAHDKKDLRQDRKA